MAWFKLKAGTHLENGRVHKAKDPGTQFVESDQDLVELGGAAKFERVDHPPEGYRSQARPLMTAPAPERPLSSGQAPEGGEPAKAPAPQAHPPAHAVAKESDLKKK